ncbi:MAG: hypothetical protein ABFR90_07095 [Planctomycetota bacterium]
MTKKTWIVWALLLLLPGTVGLSIQIARKRAVKNRVARASQKVDQSSALKEYLQMYEQWSNLPTYKKADNPWGYGPFGGIEIRNRLEEGQSDRVAADLLLLEKGFMHYPEELVDVLYGPDWQQGVAEHKNKRATTEVILIVSTFFLAGGGLISAGGLSRMLVLYLKERASKKEDQESESDSEEEAEADDPKIVSGEGETSDEASSQEESLEGLEASLSEPSQAQEHEDDLSEHKDDLSENEDKQSEDEDDLSEYKDDLSEDEDDLMEHKDDTPKHKGKGYFQSREGYNGARSFEACKETELPMKPVAPKSSLLGKAQEDSFAWADEEDDPAELETMMTTEPLTKELTELTEEVSAIRQFAASQQDQMRKLQDGYDWMIIRRFSLRIIRSIDNIDDRVVRLQANGEDAAMYLEDIRDELVFALEASGIEQFKPDLNIPFKGLEKYAEAVRERVFTEDADLIGSIADVARPGYQYLVNDDDVKIVRCAQVKLYESKQT